MAVADQLFASGRRGNVPNEAIMDMMWRVVVR
jgi:hypothetical protein